MEEFEKLRVIYAEDEPLTRQVVKSFLKKRFHVIDVPDGEKAMIEYEKMKPDFIITDISMPIKDGFQLIKEIRNVDSTTPVFVTTAYRDLCDDIPGVTKCFEKPLECRAMIEIIDSFFKDNAL